MAVTLRGRVLDPSGSCVSFARITEITADTRTGFFGITTGGQIETVRGISADAEGRYEVRFPNILFAEGASFRLLTTVEFNPAETFRQVSGGVDRVASFLEEKLRPRVPESQLASMVRGAIQQRFTGKSIDSFALQAARLVDGRIPLDIRLAVLAFPDFLNGRLCLPGLRREVEAFRPELPCPIIQNIRERTEDIIAGRPLVARLQEGAVPGAVVDVDIGGARVVSGASIASGVLNIDPRTLLESGVLERGGDLRARVSGAGCPAGRFRERIQPGQIRAATPDELSRLRSRLGIRLAPPEIPRPGIPRVTGCPVARLQRRPPRLVFDAHPGRPVNVTFFADDRPVASFVAAGDIPIPATVLGLVAQGGRVSAEMVVPTLPECGTVEATPLEVPGPRRPTGERVERAVERVAQVRAKFIEGLTLPSTIVGGLPFTVLGSVTVQRNGIRDFAPQQQVLVSVDGGSPVRVVTDGSGFFSTNITAAPGGHRIDVVAPANGGAPLEARVTRFIVAEARVTPEVAERVERERRATVEAIRETQEVLRRLRAAPII